MSEPENLTPRMHAAIAALLACPTEGAAADQSGVSPATLRRWKAREDFRDELRRQSRRLLDETTARLRVDAERARQVLRDALDAPQPGHRIRAAIAMLTIAHQVDLDELARRIEALEARERSE